MHCLLFFNHTHFYTKEVDIRVVEWSLWLIAFQCLFHFLKKKKKSPLFQNVPSYIATRNIYIVFSVCKTISPNVQTDKFILKSKNISRWSVSYSNILGGVALEVWIGIFWTKANLIIFSGTIHSHSFTPVDVFYYLQEGKLSEKQKFHQWEILLIWQQMHTYTKDRKTPITLFRPIVENNNWTFSSWVHPHIWKNLTDFEILYDIVILKIPSLLLSTCNLSLVSNDASLVILFKRYILQLQLNKILY